MVKFSIEDIAYIIKRRIARVGGMVVIRICTINSITLVMFE